MTITETFINHNHEENNSIKRQIISIKRKALKYFTEKPSKFTRIEFKVNYCFFNIFNLINDVPCAKQTLTKV